MQTAVQSRFARASELQCSSQKDPTQIFLEHSAFVNGFDSCLQVQAVAPGLKSGPKASKVCLFFLSCSCCPPEHSWWQAAAGAVSPVAEESEEVGPRFHGLDLWVSFLGDHDNAGAVTQLGR